MRKAKPFTLAEAIAHIRERGFFRTTIAIAVDRALKEMARARA